MILTPSAHNFALHVSDRLVSLVSGKRVEPYEPLANKSVILVTKDAVVALAYTGRSILDQAPADQRIAEILIKRRYPIPPEPFAIECGQQLPWSGVRSALEGLRVELDAVWKRVPRSQQKEYFGILGTGWRWKRGKRPRRLTFMLTKRIGSVSFELWRRNARSWMEIFGAPSGPVSRVDFGALQEVAQRTKNVDEVERSVVQAIRAVSTVRSMGVGPNCMSILIPRPNPERRWVRVRYHPAEGHSLTVPFYPNRPSVLAAFTPWIIGDGLIHPPMVFAGDYSVSAGGFDIRLRSPHPPGGWLDNFISPYRRKS